MWLCYLCGDVAYTVAGGYIVFDIRFQRSIEYELIGGSTVLLLASSGYLAAWFSVDMVCCEVARYRAGGLADRSWNAGHLRL